MTWAATHRGLCRCLFPCLSPAWRSLMRACGFACPACGAARVCGAVRRHLQAARPAGVVRQRRRPSTMSACAAWRTWRLRCGTTCTSPARTPPSRCAAPWQPVLRCAALCVGARMPLCCSMPACPHMPCSVFQVAFHMAPAHEHVDATARARTGPSSSAQRRVPLLVLVLGLATCPCSRTHTCGLAAVAWPGLACRCAALRTSRTARRSPQATAALCWAP